jgi:hypothetical protein
VKGWQFNNQLAYTNFKTQFNEGSFLRPVIDISKELKRLKDFRLGFRYTWKTIKQKIRLRIL